MYMYIQNGTFNSKYQASVPNQLFNTTKNTHTTSYIIHILLHMYNYIISHSNACETEVSRFYVGGV